MTPAEADKIIAEFMGWQKVPGNDFCYWAIPEGFKFETMEDLSAFWRREPPSSSLADMPLVWNAMNVKYTESDARGFGGYIFGVKIARHAKFTRGYHDEIEPAAAIATAKGIERMG